MQNNTVNRLILKDSDVLLIRVPRSFFQNKESLMGIYANIKKKLLPRKNKIMILPIEIEISVIGSEEVKEYISNIDLWSLWDENGDKVDEI
jgi:hypothetical protein